MDKSYVYLFIAMAVIIGGMGWKLFQSWKHPYPAKEEAEKAKGKKEDEIKNTPAADLVASDPGSEGLRADAAGIAGRAKRRLRDRIGEIVSRVNGTGDTGGGGS
jgi:hypothetical protein